MKVLSLSLVYPNPEEPGLGLFVRARLQALARLAEVKVIAPVPVLDYSNPRQRWWRRGGVPAARRDGPVEVRHPRWVYPPGGTPWNVLCLFVRLLPSLLLLRRRFRFHLIDAHFGYPEGVAGALLAMVLRTRFLVTLRGSEQMFARYRCRRWCLRWALRRADAVVAVSEQLRKFAIEMGAAAARTRTIPNGIDAGVFHPREREQCRARLGIAPGARVIVTAGELIEAKGHHLVISAAQELLRAGRDVIVLVAGGVARGGRPFEREIRGLIARLGMQQRVRMLGWVDRNSLAETMNAADVFCLASYTEGWPNVVHEAMACGVPVVATRVGAVADMMTEAVHGLIVPPRDAAALAVALGQALERDWDRAAIARHGRSRGWDRVATEVLEVMGPLSESGEFLKLPCAESAESFTSIETTR